VTGIPRGEQPAETETPPGQGGGLSFRSISRSAAILTGAAAGVQVIGIVREVFVAAQVGLSTGYDALLIALVIPTTFAGVLTAGTVTAMVPAYLQVREEGGREGARRLAGVITFWVGLCGLVIWLLLEAIGPLAIAVAGPGLEQSGREAAVSYLHILAPLAFVSAVTAVLGGVCQAEERFAVIATSSFAGAIANLATTLLLWQPLELGALALANLIGPVTTGIVLALAALRSSIAPRLTVWTTREQLSTFARHAAPLTLSSAILQFNGVADRAIASLIAPGAVSALRYADVLVRTPIGAISPAWGTALYPSLVRVAHEGGSGLGNATSRAVRYVLAAFVPIAVLTIAVAPVAVAVGYGRGAFSQTDVARTAEAVAAFAPIIVVMMCYPPFTGALNARRRGGILLAGGVANVCLNLLLDIVLGITLGAAGVALSSSLTAIVVLVFFAGRLARSEDDFVVAPITRTLLLAVAASLPVALPIALLCWLGAVPGGLVVGLLALFLFGTLGLLGYLLIATRLGLDEARALAQLIGEWYSHRRGAARTTR
jgi:putative peptidoglycan lipid II flippase